MTLVLDDASQSGILISNIISVFKVHDTSSSICVYAVHVSSAGVTGTQTSSQTAADVLLSVGLTLAVTIIIISVAVLISCKKRSSKVKGEATGNTHRATMMAFPTVNSERNVLFVGLLLNVNTILKQSNNQFTLCGIFQTLSLK